MFEMLKKIIPDDDAGCATSCVSGLTWFISIFLIIITFPISLIFCVRIVQEYERAVIFRLGRVKRNGTVGPGMFFIVPCLDTVSISIFCPRHTQLDTEPLLSLDNGY